MKEITVDVISARFQLLIKIVSYCLQGLFVYCYQLRGV